MALGDMNEGFSHRSGGKGHGWSTRMKLPVEGSQLGIFHQTNPSGCVPSNKTFALLSKKPVTATPMYRERTTARKTPFHEAMDDYYC